MGDDGGGIVRAVLSSVESVSAVFRRLREDGERRRRERRKEDERTHPIIGFPAYIFSLKSGH